MHRRPSDVWPPPGHPKPLGLAAAAIPEWPTPGCETPPHIGEACPNEADPSNPAIPALSKRCRQAMTVLGRIFKSRAMTATALPSRHCKMMWARSTSRPAPRAVSQGLAIFFGTAWHRSRLGHRPPALPKHYQNQISVPYAIKHVFAHSPPGSIQRLVNMSWASLYLSARLDGSYLNATQRATRSPP